MANLAVWRSGFPADADQLLTGRASAHSPSQSPQGCAAECMQVAEGGLDLHPGQAVTERGGQGCDFER